MKKSKLATVFAVLTVIALLFTACIKTNGVDTKEPPTYEQAYAQAVSLGYTGSLEDFINILKGDSGDSAYDIAVKNGFEGTEAQWLQTLKGKTAYEIAVENGFEGTVTEWLQSLKGDQGEQGAQGEKGEQGAQGEQGLPGDNGATGDNGLSAYEIALINGFIGTETDWLNSLLKDSNNNDISAIIKSYQLTLSVVEINSFYGESSGLSSGVIISNDGYILTNAHCVVYDFGEAPDTEVLFDSVVAKFRNDETEHEIEIIDYDITKDLAIVKFVQCPQNLNAIVLGDSDSLEIGDTAIVVGNAVGLGITAASGIISETPRNYTVSYIGVNPVEAIRTDAAVNPGNSGGALINKDGQLIGIVTFKIASDIYESLGFAISVNFAKSYIDSVLTISYTSV